MASIAIDVSHGCGPDAAPAPGVIPVQRKASSSCCGATLAEGGTDETGHTCTACRQPATKVLGEPTAHWTCKCGQRRSQVITTPTEG